MKVARALLNSVTKIFAVLPILLPCCVGAQTTLPQPNVIVDTIKPTVTITAPTASEKWSNSLFTVAGKAKDNVAVTNVFVSLNGGDWGSALLTNNGSNWTQQVTLIPGTNTIAAFAVDSSGNNSATNQVKMFYYLPAPLALATNGGGAVTPYHDGSMLNLGFGYALTAKAATGSKFVNWTDGLGNPITNGLILKFTMTSNADFVANFEDIARPTLTITNPVKSGAKCSNNVIFTVAGKCGDNVGVSNVMVSLNSADWQTAALGGTSSNWTQQVTLIPGTNTIAAFAMDAAGNVSLTNTTTVIFYPDTRVVFGTWNLVQFQTPARVYFDSNTNLQGGGGFGVTTGTMTFFTNGTLSGSLGDVFTGSFVDNSNGTLTATIISGGNTNDYTFFANAAKDTISEVDTLLDSDDNHQEMVLGQRMPASLAPADVAGSWNLSQFRSPAQLYFDAGNNFQGGDTFSVTNGTLTLNANGTFSAKLENSVSGTFTVSSNAVVTLNPSSGNEQINLFVNFSKDNMVEVQHLFDNNDNNQEIVVAHRVPASANLAALVGDWNLVQISTPAQITADTSGNIQNGSNFGVTTGTLTINANGSISGTLGDAFTGTVTVASGGAIHASITSGGQTTPFTFYLNAGKDTMTEVSSALTVNDNHSEIVIAHRVASN
jgi:hypothetical protein